MDFPKLASLQLQHEGGRETILNEGFGEGAGGGPNAFSLSIFVN
jgi:hypothetical protein